MGKDYIRKKTAVRLDSLSPKEKLAKSLALEHHLTSTSQWKNSEYLFTFLPFGREPDLDPLIRLALSREILVSAPRITGKGLMEFFPFGDFSNSCLSTNKWGIREPVSIRRVVPLSEKINLMLVPGAAFSEEGDRLGRGGGFYDRYLERFKKNLFLMGVCFEEQIVSDIPIRRHDIPMNMIITDQRIILPKASTRTSP